MNKTILFGLITAGFICASAVAAENPSALDELLQEKIKKVESMNDDTDVLQAIRAANTEQSAITAEEIAQLDQRWVQAKPEDEFTRTFIAGFMNNACASHLQQFQTENPGYKEIFVSDAKGLNVCQTNKTSDYYQADESWWVKAFAGGKGQSYFGPIEYDESARLESISVFVPIMDPETHLAIGVTKAVIDISILKEEL